MRGYWQLLGVDWPYGVLSNITCKNGSSLVNISVIINEA